ncbi:hypothetical protein T4A_3131 [Trichinella pseudospiralis]|uniref:Uncharacterized protein n=1 Tax=Trichinella pseudospiralis TaxID=6337 RepID=A0A0V1IYE1_TRIPS|nr:hypothetical protein T4A_3131 [Trichinella pseudospiralis]KRZ27750.1 hypothetical protein T4C_4895 [Trichinella pseudospiralis]
MRSVQNVRFNFTNHRPTQQGCSTSYFWHLRIIPAFVDDDGNNDDGYAQTNKIDHIAKHNFNAGGPSLKNLLLKLYNDFPSEPQKISTLHCAFTFYATDSELWFVHGTAADVFHSSEISFPMPQPRVNKRICIKRSTKRAAHPIEKAFHTE